MSTLYELTGNRLALQQKLEMMNLDEETITDTLEGESTELEGKIQDYGFVIQNRNSFATAIRSEIDRLQTRLKSEENRVKKVEEWLLMNMQACNIQKVECPAFTISVRQNPPSVDVLDEKLIPTEYMRTPEPKPPVPAPDKRAILEAIKKGEEVPGCTMKRTVKLEIK